MLKLTNKKHKIKKIKLLKSIMQKIISKSQLNNLISSYQINANSNNILSSSK